MKIPMHLVLLAFAVPMLAQPTLPSGTYTYDGAGNITAIGPNTYSYDSLGRLAKAVVVSGDVTHTQEFAYDAYGNMTSTKTDGAVTNIGVDPDTNRLTGVVADAYDEAGNLRIDGSFQYTYDSQGQMSEKVTPAVHEYYIYDANDERIAVRAAPDNWQFTFRDLSGKPLRQFRASELNNWSQQWTWVQDWVWREGQLLGSEHPPTDGGRQHYHLDHLGTPRLATTANGVAVAHHDYYPYGVEITPLRQETAAGFSQEQAMKFTGHERDFTGGTAAENTNYLDYMHARSYSPILRRFLSVDSASSSAHAGQPQSWNRYIYATNNPIGIVDPDGEEGVHVINTWNHGEYSAQIDASVQRRLTSLGIHYVRSTEIPDSTLRSILADPTNRVIMMGHGIEPFNGGSAFDFLVRPRLANGALDGLLSGGYTVRAQSLSLIGCQTLTVPIQVPGVVTTTNIFSNQSLLVAQTLAIQQDNGASLERAATLAETSTLNSPLLQQPQPNFDLVTRSQALLNVVQNVILP